MKHHQIRAKFDSKNITVYQAFSPAIADAALRNGTFVPPFSFQRMTWIKPSFLWMMERSGYGSKSGQERVLSIEISRAGWEEALANAVLTAPLPGQGSEEWREALDEAPIRVQWDPERTLRGGKSEQRSIQVGIARDWSRRYAEEWIQSLTDITPLVSKMAAKRRLGQWDAAAKLVPAERPYPLPEALRARLDM